MLASLLLELRLWAAAPVAVQRSVFALCLKLSQVWLISSQQIPRWWIVPLGDSKHKGWAYEVYIQGTQLCHGACCLYYPTDERLSPSICYVTGRQVGACPYDVHGR